jgi:hypothetical protein
VNQIKGGRANLAFIPQGVDEASRKGGFAGSQFADKPENVSWPGTARKVRSNLHHFEFGANEHGFILF